MPMMVDPSFHNLPEHLQEDFDRELRRGCPSPTTNYLLHVNSKLLNHGQTIESLRRQVAGQEKRIAELLVANHALEEKLRSEK